MKDFEAKDLLDIIQLFHDERKKAYGRSRSSEARDAIAVEMSDLEYIRAVIEGHQGAEDAC